MFYMTMLLQPEKQAIIFMHHLMALICILNIFFLNFNIGENTLAKQNKLSKDSVIPSIQNLSLVPLSTTGKAV